MADTVDWWDATVVDCRGERILIFLLLSISKKIFTNPYPTLIRKFLEFSIRYPSVSECDTGWIRKNRQWL